MSEAITHARFAERISYLASHISSWAGSCLTLPEKHAKPMRASSVERFIDAILAYESTKPKEADRLKELAATCPTILKAGRKLAADRVSGKVVVGCYGDVPAVEFKRLAAMLSAAGDGNG